MAYSSSLQYFYPIDGSGDPEINSFETGVTQAEFVMPFDGQIEEFGVYISEDLTAQNTDAVYTLKTAPTIGGSETSQIALTVGNSNTALKQGDGVKAAQTAISVDADIDNGDVVLAKRSLLPIQIAAGTVVILESTTQSTGAGGAGFAFFGYRHSGVNLAASNVWVQTE
jgi:hypothetical protein